MKNNNKKIISILLIILSIVSIEVNAYAHSGRTDSSGGHKDNKNKSGLGSYHYHCGGHPAHLHNGGVCPYSSNKDSTKGSTSSSKKTISTVPTTIAVTDIKINENVTNMEEGESKKLTATIMPNNATDKNIIWKSSNESIAMVSTTGEVTAKKCGTVDITAISANGKTSTIKIYVKDIPKVENKLIVNEVMVNDINMSNSTVNNMDDSNSLGVVMALGLLGGGSYWGYKKHKKS